MSNSLPMLQRLSKTCKGGHKHQALLSGRAAAAAFYPLPLLKAILQGVADTARLDSSVADMSSSEYDTSLLLSIAAVSPDEKVATQASKVSGSAGAATNSENFSKTDLEPGSLPVEGGGTVNIHYAAKDFKDVYLDEYTREPFTDQACAECHT